MDKPASKQPTPGQRDPKKTALLERKRKHSPQDPALTQPFTDNFERTQLGDDWRATSSNWRIEDGRLCGSQARNHPVWLARRLPTNASIQFDAMSSSEDGDLKAEFWGDGSSFASSVSYTDATSYLTIFGGWKNRYHVLARIDEHAKDRLQVKVNPGGDDLRALPVEPNRSYRFKVTRHDGKTIKWLVDDIEMLELEDDKPLRGPGHEHFGFNDWSVKVCFDNLKITPL